MSAPTKIKLYRLFSDDGDGNMHTYTNIGFTFNPATNQLTSKATPKGGLWQFRYSYEGELHKSAGYLVHVWVKDGTPIW